MWITQFTKLGVRNYSFQLNYVENLTQSLVLPQGDSFQMKLISVPDNQYLIAGKWYYISIVHSIHCIMKIFPLTLNRKTPSVHIVY